MIIDNLLPETELKFLQEAVMWNDLIQYRLHNQVANNEEKDSLDNWYGTSMIYADHRPTSEHFDEVQSIFTKHLPDFVAWIRIKINFYPHTTEIYEHEQHYDCKYSHGAAIFCLNTCDGYTRLGEDTIIESVENRLYLFDGCIKHNSTTTTNAKGRFNFNFNYMKAQKFL